MAEVTDSSMRQKIGGQNTVELISVLQADNQSLRREVNMLKVEVGLITDWITDKIGVKLIEKESKLYKELHPGDEESQEIRKKLTSAEKELSAEGGGCGEGEDGNNGDGADPAAVQVEDHAGIQLHAQPVLPAKTLVIQIRRLEDDPAARACLTRRQAAQQQSIAGRERPTTAKIKKSASRNQNTTKNKTKKTRKLHSKHCCRFCRKELQTPYTLREHERIHNAERPFKCHLCEKMFKSVGGQRSHLRIHTRERPYECNICGNTFTTHGALKDHQLRHAGQRKYKCHFCTSRFTTNGDRVRHERTHTGEKPFSCKVCGQRFAQCGGRLRHEMIHTGRKPFKCQICQKRYRQRSTLEVHLKSLQHRNKANTQNPQN